MGLDMSVVLILVAILLCTSAAAALLWPKFLTSAKVPEVDAAKQSSTSRAEHEGNLHAKAKTNGIQDLNVLTTEARTRQMSLSDSGSNDSGPAAVSPQRRSASILPIPEWPTARWSKVLDASLPKKATSLVFEVESASRRQKHRE